MAFGPIARNLGALYLLHGANVVVPLVLIPYLTRVLGPASYGAVAFGQSFVWFFLVIANWGFTLSATRAVARSRDDPEALRRLVAEVMGAKLILLGAGFALFLGLLVLVPGLRVHAALHLLLFATVVGQVILPVWLFQGLERMATITALNAGTKLAGLALTFALVRAPGDAPIYAALLGLQWVAAGALGLWLARPFGGLVRLRLDLAATRRTLAEGWPLFLSNLANLLYTSANPFLLGLFAPLGAVGLYSGAERVMFGLVSLLTPLSQAFFPRLSALQATAPAAAFRLARRLLVAMVGLGCLFGLALALGSGPLARFYLGPDFIAAAPLMVVLAPVIPLLALINVLGIQIMVPLGRDRAYRDILIVMAAVNLAGAALFAPGGGAIGMAIAVLASVAAGVLLMAIYLARRGLLPFVAEHGVPRP